MTGLPATGARQPTASTIGARCQRIFQHARDPRSLPALFWKNIKYAVGLGRTDDPAQQLIPLRQAWEHFHAGRLDSAAQICQQILRRAPKDAPANNLSGLIHHLQGDNPAARDLLMRATARADATADMHNNLGRVLLTLGDNNAALKAFRRALALNPDDAVTHNNLGIAYGNAKKTEAAINAFQHAIQLDPHFGSAKANLRALYNELVPAWHFGMLSDRERNDAYEAAIRRAVRGKHVLDIGAGAGLLSLMAARAGASHITACEVVGIIAERTRDIVALNGFAPCVTVIGKHSQHLVVGKDLPQRAEVLVTETFSDGLLEEHVLPTVADAHARLLAPNAIVIPSAASAMGYLVGGEQLREMWQLARVSGFDMTPFNDFARRRIKKRLDHFPYEILSGDIELARFDLRDKVFPMARRLLEVEATRAGVAVGVAQWIKLQLDAEARYENRPSPEAPFRQWTQVVHCFAEPLSVAPGDLVQLTVSHTRNRLEVDLASVS